MSFHPDDPSLISFSSASGIGEKKQNKLKMKNQKLSDDNSKLREALNQKSSEVSSLNERISKLTKSIESLTLEYSSVTSAKVVELSKKNRQITSELHVVKSKCRSLEESKTSLEKLLEAKDEQLKLAESVNESQSPSESQMIADKLERSNKKVFEILNQNTSLKNDLKMAHKALHREIGENFNVAQLMSGTSNWRGRAEMIAMLNSKIAELKEKLDNASMDSFDCSSRLPLKRLESMRRLEVETLTKELEDCKGQLEEVKMKVLAMKTRNKILSDDSNNYKLKTLDLLEKSGRDEEFINCLNEQISMMKFECNHKTEEARKEVERAEKEKLDAENETQMIRCQMQNLEELIDEKNNEISNLKRSTEELETNLREVAGEFLFSCRSMNKDDYMTLVTNLEQDKKNLLTFMQELNERLDKESVKVSEQHDMIVKQRLKIARLDGKLKELEAEKEAVKTKHRRIMRISEYSRSHSISSLSGTQSNDKLTTEIDKYKFKLESAMERIEFLEKKVKEKSDEHAEDNQRFISIIGTSMANFKNLFEGNGNEEASLSTTQQSECPESTITSFVDN